MTSNLLTENRFLLGANLAWLDGQYDHDFGKNQIMNISNSKYNKTSLRTYLQDIKNMGIQVVRLWVFERFEGLIFDDNGFVTLDRTLLDNLADACSIASQIGLRFYLCLADTWGLYHNESQMIKKIQYLSAMNGLITTKDKTLSFIDNAVLPIITDSRIKNSIFAVDVLNEPEGLKPEKVTEVVASGAYPPISWEQILNYVKTCADSIKANTDLRVSCGFSDVNNIRNDPYGLQNHLDFFDYHVYNDEGTLFYPYSSLGLSKPCIIGEFGQDKREWDDSLQAEVICSFLNDSLNKGYAGCFVWNYNYKGFTSPDWNWWSLINSDGSHRPVCSLINQFSKKI